MIHTLTQRHFLSMLTPAAILRCVGRVHFDSCSSSFFRFDEQLIKKSRPCCISNALRKTMIVRHPVDLQVFDSYHTKSVNDLATILMGEIIPSESNPLMHTGNYLLPVCYACVGLWPGPFLLCGKSGGSRSLPHWRERQRS